ncbi:hypothetical protein ACFFWC_09630 [Plantactinospora siamensis]|uniref:Uncharacterized protein n=1 Tax=Plantactinospora siamensis TaxID=555372 RepID=A0ABV6P4N1_9ACTN
MVRPRRSTHEQRVRVAEALARWEVPPVLVQKWNDPRRLVRDPCDDQTCGLCWGTVEQAEEIRRTGLPAERREH